MKIALLDTGKPPANLRDRWPDGYPGMMAGLMGRAGDEFTTFDVQQGTLPETAGDFDAAIVLGSPAGVYEDHPWIPPLFDFLREARGETKLVGVCFGHQAMAQAFGGRVEKSERGWGLGLHRYEVCEQRPWMGSEPPEEVAIPVSHQDQVVEQPPASTVIACSRFTPFAALAYDQHPAISFQFHPEFEPEYAACLIERRIELGQVRGEHAELALQSLHGPNDRPVVAGWIRSFLEE